MNTTFKRRYDGPRLTAEQAARQGDAVRLAFDAFGGSAAAIAYLNQHDDALGGRPIDLVVASPEGLASVAQAMAAMPRPS